MYWSEFRDPFADMRRLQREVNSLFSGFSEDSERFPALNLWSNDQEAILMAEIPGMNPQDLDITVKGDLLTLKGERKGEDMAKEGMVCHRAERGSGSFCRGIRIPFEAENSKVHAQYAKGVLTITLPRAESSKPKKIAIEG